MSVEKRHSIFRPCIDLHQGVVKQIVGGSLRDDDRTEQQERALNASGIDPASSSSLKTNFTSTLRAGHYASLYHKHNLTGAHVIKLGPGNDEAATEAVQAWPNGLQVGGGITSDNAKLWIDKGAQKVIVTSYLFPNCKFSMERLQALESLVGKERLVVDVSCRRREGKWIVAMNRWQDLTDMEVNEESLNLLANHCSEFLIHAADVEGLCQGIDEELVQKLGEWVSIPTTYAGGARNIQDLHLVDRCSNGKVDLTFGSALDIFGGTGVTMQELIDWNDKYNS
jgi:phosphoribosylformimino-5-aminoimidazole carboxamide ribotide isomerase